MAAYGGNSRMKPLIEAETGHSTGPYIIEVQKGLRAVRNLRDGLTGLVYQLVAHRDKKGILILNDPKITSERLNTEWHHAQHAFKPEVIKRLRLVLLKDGQFMGLPDDFSQEDQKRLYQRISDVPRPKARSSSHPDSYYVVLETLLQHWLLGRGPMTVVWIRNVTGYSYPTVSEA